MLSKISNGIFKCVKKYVRASIKLYEKFIRKPIKTWYPSKVFYIIFSSKKNSVKSIWKNKTGARSYVRKKKKKKKESNTRITQKRRSEQFKPPPTPLISGKIKLEISDVRVVQTMDC